MQVAGGPVRRSERPRIAAARIAHTVSKIGIASAITGTIKANTPRPLATGEDVKRGQREAEEVAGRCPAHEDRAGCQLKKRSRRRRRSRRRTG